ncbi:hypothetical protein PGT21_019462 [Puccinia graminis f. sp. tritici]|uniref:Uncharacterized protein n=1 Tax=Puccinia graminis f. sp. tritici TaxID=56615 RepID=A0A5B0P9S3_PUCGR|nr:hypothetical protein PGT21_019462 [Puccinia graminis f. sp. tritici]KAA1125994.1 hypothetical protein PGTUg99_008636 [Puccinia graminis f. sp. tritici]
MLFGQSKTFSTITTRNRLLTIVSTADGAIVDGDGGSESQYKPWPLVPTREMSGDEANNLPASKKPKLDLQLSLGLSSKDAESVKPGPSSHQSRRSHPNGKPLTLQQYLFQMGPIMCLT